MSGTLERVCASCGRAIGDHTLRQYGECSDRPMAAPELAERLGLDSNQKVADHLTCKALAVELDDGTTLPGVLLEFGVGFEGDVLGVANVVYVADKPQNIRQLGRVVRDAANIAANATEP